MSKPRSLTNGLPLGKASLNHLYYAWAPGPFFGLKLLRDRFPEARALAMPRVVNAMQAALRPESVENWRRRFPGLISESLAVAERLDQPAFQLEVNQILPVTIGHTDTDHTTCLHVPSIALVIAGDAIYNST